MERYTLEDVTGDQLKSIRLKFFDLVKSKSADFCAVDLERVKTDDIWLKRFIAHVELDINAAADMLFEACQWRKDFGTNELNEKKMPAHLFEKGVLFIRNKDVYGKHLLIFKAKYHSKGVEDIENLKKFIVYYFDRIERVSKSDQISIVFDMEGTGWNNMDMDFIRYLITLLKTYYPFFVNYLMIYEMPWLLNAAWKIIKGWLPEKFVERVKFVNKKTMKEFIDLDNQLAEWGGKDSYKYTFVPEVLPAPTATTKVLQSPSPQNNNFQTAQGGFPELQNLQARKDRLQLSGVDEVMDGDDTRANQTSLTPSPRTNFAEPVRRMNVESSEGPFLVDVTDRIVLTKDSGDRVSGRFQIRNVAPGNDALIYKIKTTAPEKFHVRPTLGLVEANATSNVIITVQSGGYLRSIGHERFQVQVVVAPKDLLDGLNGNQQGGDAANSDLHGDLSKMWKRIASKEARIENHRVGCTLDASITDAMISPSGANLVTMNEEEMRKGLNQIEQRIVEKIQSEMVKKHNKVEKLLYIIIGLLIVLLLSLWWSSPSSSSAEQYCHKYNINNNNPQ